MEEVLYECWNPDCRKYAGYKIRLKNSEVLFGNKLTCKYCSTWVRRAGPSNRGAQEVVGFAGGAVLGALVGGAVGGVIGAIIGLAAASQNSDGEG